MLEVKTEDICTYIDERLSMRSIKDFPHAHNGLQIANNGKVTRLGGAVDASPRSLQLAIQKQIDFLCVHHGLFWSMGPLVRTRYPFYKSCFDHNVAIYSAHFPLDVHATLGHNAEITKRLALKSIDRFAIFEGQYAGWVTTTQDTREELRQKLSTLFPRSLHAFEFGPLRPKRIGIVAGSGGQSLLEQAVEQSIDTLITGEVRHAAFNFAQDYDLNIYACGHYATEVFGVQNLLADVAEKFHLPYAFIDVFCDL